MRVTVLGCGYVGVELGERLTDAGHDVAGVRRSEEGLAAIRSAGFEAVRADVTDPASLADVPDADAVVFAASSGGRGPGPARETYVEGQATAVEAFGRREDPPDRWIYTGSTGVYGNRDGEWVTEATPPLPESDRGQVLLEAEGVARETAAEYGIDGTVLRYGGLYGPGRYRLERYLSEPVTETHINLTHRVDAARIVRHLLETDRGRDDVLNAVDDEPAWKPDLTAWLGEQCGVDPPLSVSVEERLADADLSEGARRRIRTDRRCSNEKLRGLDYEFEYPTFREGYREAVDEYLAERTT